MAGSHKVIDLHERIDTVAASGCERHRFVNEGKPIAAIHLGRTRADDLFTLKVIDRCASALHVLAS